MNATELRDKLNDLIEEQGDLKVAIEKPAGLFSSIETISNKFILNAITKREDAAELHGASYFVIEPKK